MQHFIAHTPEGKVESIFMHLARGKWSNSAPDFESIRNYVALFLKLERLPLICSYGRMGRDVI